MLYVDLFDSRAIHMFAYDLDARRLLIRFKNGDVYAYQDVPREVFERFRQARSKGQFFRSTLRDRFVSHRLSAREVAAIARIPGAAGLSPRQQTSAWISPRWSVRGKRRFFSDRGG